MNDLETKMNETLHDLCKHHGAVGLKTEFEAEGARFNEVVILNRVRQNTGLGLYVKIGGCEAVRDFCDAALLGATGIIGPMIESPFALTKFIRMAEARSPGYDIELGMTFETKTALEQLDLITSCDVYKELDTVTIGRTDLSDSLGLQDINGEEMFQCCEKIVNGLGQVRKCVGGKITEKALEFVNKLGVRRTETRKVILALPNADLGVAIKKALYFEYLWLLNKRHYYGSIANEEDARIERLRSELG